MGNPMFQCLNCGLMTDSPSWSDASTERLDEDGQIRHDHHHIPVCPECFQDARVLPDLTRVLLDIAKPVDR